VTVASTPAPVIGSAPATISPAQPAVPAPKQETSVNSPATVVVKAPADVRITVNGQPASRTTTEETFTTPVLQAGQSYYYVFQAEAVRNGKPITIKRHVQVRAGQQSQVDFRDFSGDVAHVTVRLPADAQLYVDGVLCTLSPSPVRSFDTPKLEFGHKYSYTLKAEVVRNGNTRSESQRVLLEPGKDVNVEFKGLEKPLQSVSR